VRLEDVDGLLEFVRRGHAAQKVVEDLIAERRRISRNVESLNAQPAWRAGWQLYGKALGYLK